jgi:hypothetical protein
VKLSTTHAERSVTGAVVFDTVYEPSTLGGAFFIGAAAERRTGEASVPEAGA